MRDTRFIFVEGIVGAGKSSTATFLTDQLPRNGIAARFMPEGPTIFAAGSSPPGRTKRSIR